MWRKPRSVSYHIGTESYRHTKRLGFVWIWRRNTLSPRLSCGGSQWPALSGAHSKFPKRQAALSFLAEAVFPRSLCRRTAAHVSSRSLKNMQQGSVSRLLLFLRLFLPLLLWQRQLCYSHFINPLLLYTIHSETITVHLDFRHFPILWYPAQSANDIPA